VSHIKGRKQAKGTPAKGTEENIWAQKGGYNRRLDKTA